MLIILRELPFFWLWLSFYSYSPLFSFCPFSSYPPLLFFVEIWTFFASTSSFRRCATISDVRISRTPCDTFFRFPGSVEVFATSETVSESFFLIKNSNLDLPVSILPLVSEALAACFSVSRSFKWASSATVSLWLGPGTSSDIIGDEEAEATGGGECEDCLWVQWLDSSLVSLFLNLSSLIRSKAVSGNLLKFMGNSPVNSKPDRRFLDLKDSSHRVPISSANCAFVNYFPGNFLLCSIRSWFNLL